jgi:threonine dehydratase
MSLTIDDIRAAAALIKGRVIRTPAVSAPVLSRMSGAKVTLKLENLQPTGSFKVRGALVRLDALDEAERKAGVVAASAGNHAQGVAYHARALAIPAAIVMPETTPFTKIRRTEALGAEIILRGDSLFESEIFARRLAEKEGRAFIHPYDDERVIAGQGTIGLELIEDCPDLDAVIVPVGGGGLIGGITTAVKALKPSLKVFGVEAALYPSMHRQLSNGYRQGEDGQEQDAGGQTVAEGIAVKTPGKLTSPIVRESVEEIFLAPEADLERAVQIYLESQRIVSEGAGAASLAALLGNRERFRGLRVALIVSGGNIDSRLMSSILMRGLARAGRMVRLRVEITDTPGALSRVTGLVGENGGNIVEVNHRRLFYDLPVKQADVDIVMETMDKSHVAGIIEKLNGAGFPARLLGSTSEDSSG